MAKPEDHFAETLLGLNAARCKVRACGSKVTNNPVPIGADNDFLVYVPHDAFAQVVEMLTEDGYKSESDDYTPNAPGPEEFKSWRKRGPDGSKNDSVNLLLVTDERFWRVHGVATNLLKHLNLQNKDDRIRVMQAVLYQVEWRP